MLELRGLTAASGDEVSFQFGDRRWRVRGLPSKPQPGSLRVNLLCSREGGAFHVDTLELYSAKQRGAWLKQASLELGQAEEILKSDLAALLRACGKYLRQAGIAFSVEYMAVTLVKHASIARLLVQLFDGPARGFLFRKGSAVAVVPVSTAGRIHEESEVLRGLGVIDVFDLENDTILVGNIGRLCARGGGDRQCNGR